MSEAPTITRLRNVPLLSGSADPHPWTGHRLAMSPAELRGVADTIPGKPVFTSQTDGSGFSEIGRVTAARVANAILFADIELTAPFDLSHCMTSVELNESMTKAEAAALSPGDDRYGYDLRPWVEGAPESAS